MMKKDDKKKMLLFLIIGLTSVYGFSDMKNVFYDILKEALNISDMKLGSIWSAFGIAAMLSYIGGGFLADRFAPSKVISIALILSGVLHIGMASAVSSRSVSYLVLLCISIGMGFCAVLLFFPASSKMLTMMSREHSGSIFGKYYGFAGAFTALIYLAATFIYSHTQDALSLFQWVMRFFAAANIFAGILIILFFWNKSPQSSSNTPIHLSDTPQIVCIKKIWIIAAIIFCNYLICCLMSYFTPYLTQQLGISETQTLLIAAIRLGVFCLISGILWGMWVDRSKSAKHVICLSMAALFIIFLLLIISQYIFLGKIICISLLFCIALVALGVKSITLVLLTEENIPQNLIGTAIGFVSFIGYSPDAVFYPIAGAVMEIYGKYSFTVLFLIGLLASVFGFLCIRLLLHNN